MDNYEYFSVGNVTSWTTKGKGIFPTKAELDKGLYRFHTDGKGVEFANDPTPLYENTFKAGTTWTLRGQKKYIVRILAIYASGDGPTGRMGLYWIKNCYSKGSRVGGLYV
ncbi:hypothetical protein HCA69_16190 [Listeria grandensis]|uniref:Uncharacterized protein n=1 Tax=Listeria grandensis TaxID=1494963 RepID=A0A7X0Y6T1_9LIST|nr:hypothetical protein [Listeria grandensis]MBC1937903.1 hypothetical protein [Listeria grandensis]